MLSGLFSTMQTELIVKNIRISLVCLVNVSTTEEGSLAGGKCGSWEVYVERRE